jgi:hypothetical protein
VNDRVNMPFGLLLAVRAAVARGDAATAGYLTGRLEAEAEREVLPHWRDCSAAAVEAVAALPRSTVDERRTAGRAADLDEAFAVAAGRLTRESR